MVAKNACQFCTPGAWFVFQGEPGAGDVPPVLLPVASVTEKASGATEAKSYGAVRLGLGWDVSLLRSVDLDASVVAFNENGDQVDLVYYGKLQGCNGAVRHSGDNRTGAGEGDDEVITLDLLRVPEHITRLVCVVNSYSGVSLAHTKHAFVRLFCAGGRTIGAQALSKLCDSLGFFFCFFQRSKEGGWLFQTVMRPVPGHIATDSVPEIRNILSTISYF